jgi:hypothetical protein
MPQGDESDIVEIGEKREPGVIKKLDRQILMCFMLIKRAV